MEVFYRANVILSNFQPLLSSGPLAGPGQRSSPRPMTSSTSFVYCCQGLHGDISRPTYRLFHKRGPIQSRVKVQNFILSLIAYTLFFYSPNVNSECLCNSVKRKHAVFVMSLVLQPKVDEMADSGVLITESVRSSPEFTEPYARSVTYMERNNILQIFQVRRTKLQLLKW